MISLFFLYDRELRARHFAISCHHGLRSGFFASALNTCRRSPSNVLGDLLQVFKAEAKKPDLKPWWQEIAKWRARNSLSYKKNNDIILPQYAIERLFEATRGRDTYITTEVGQHQMWAAQFFGFEEPHRWMTSGGLGTMGYGLPAAIGVQVAHRDSLVIDIAGDASVQM